jgi:hypothetical protein
MLVYLPLLTIIAGVILFWVRSHLRFWYGVGELVAGMLVVIFVYVPHQPPYLALGGDDLPFWAPWAWTAVGTLAGLYVFVRGMDNIGQDLPARWRPVWRWLFCPRTGPTPTS